MCALSWDNTCLVTGGDDCTVRVHQISKDFQITGRIELPICGDSVSSVDIMRDNSRVVATCKDSNCYLFDLRTKSVLQKLTFKCKPDAKNMTMRSAIFRRDGGLYTLAIQPREPSFLIRWQPS